jgi:ATP-dependent DNA ligase
MKLPTLYTKDKAGHLRAWQIEHDGGAYRTTEGVVGGKMQTTAWTDCGWTNKGRANERSPVQQAEAEAKARWQKKVKAGAATDPDKCGAEWVEPMLAKKYQDQKGKLAWPVAVQAKLDGHRCLVYLKDGKPYAQTRKGEPIVAVPHILKALAPVLEAYPDLVLDGELYNHDLKADFETIASCVRKQKLTPADLAKSEKLIQYHVYDYVSGLSFEKRSQALKVDFMPKVRQRPEKRCVVRVPTCYAGTEETLEMLEEQYVKGGYEGVMVRAIDSPYESGRSSHLLKLKQFDDAEFLLVGLEPGVGNRKGLATRAILRHPSGEGTMDAGVIGDDAYTADLLANKAKYIGKEWTVKFKGYTANGKVRHAKLHRMRLG